MDMNEFAKDVLDTSTNCGLFSLDRTDAEIIDIIHCKWSDTMNKYLQDAPLAWNACSMYNPRGYSSKLIDGCMLILCYLARKKEKCMPLETLIRAAKAANRSLAEKTDLPTLILRLHNLTSKAGEMIVYALSEKEELSASIYLPLQTALSLALCWLQENQLNAEMLLTSANDYNKDRPEKRLN